MTPVVRETQGRVELVAIAEAAHSTAQRIRWIRNLHADRFRAAVEGAEARAAQPALQVDGGVVGGHRRRLVQGHQPDSTLHQLLELPAVTRIEQWMLVQSVEIQHQRRCAVERGRISRPAIGEGFDLRAPRLGCGTQERFQQAHAVGIGMARRTFTRRTADQHDLLAHAAPASREHGHDQHHDHGDGHAWQRLCHTASTTQRKPMPPERSLHGAISRYLPCWSRR